MAEALAKHKLITAVHKHYTAEDWKNYADKHADVFPYLAVSAGIQLNNKIITIYYVY